MSLYQWPTPLGGSTLSNLITLLAKNSFDGAYLPKICQILALSLIGGPSRWFEEVEYGQRFRATEINHPPIFIIGHWRSGTTYIHSLLSQDPQFGYITTHQAWAPGQLFSWRRLSRFTLKRCMPSTRPMDNVEFELDSPQEEEYVLANLSPYSFYHGWYFPNNIDEYFDKYVLFAGVTPAVREEWKKLYRHILQITTYVAGGKQLILKNPANTARIKILLELFPDAKFIHIYRNPYEVYYSTQRLYDKLLPTHTVQLYDPAALEEKFLRFYQQLMQQYFEQKDLIPAENLIEVRYDRFEQDPLSDLERIYQQFNLPNFDQAAVHFQDYVAAQASYEKNQHAMTDDVLAKVYKHWQFTIDRWGYTPPGQTVSSQVATAITSRFPANKSA